MDIDNSTIGIVITARVGSRRIPQKPLQEIGGRRAIEIQIDRLKNNKYPIIIACPDLPEDDILEKIATEKGVECYRGENDSPLHRLSAVADLYNFEHVVRITTDDVLIENEILMAQIKKHVNGDHDYTFCRRCPEGVAGEVIRSSCLKEIAKEFPGKSIEFVSYYLKRKYDVFEYYPPFAFQKPYRLVMDYPDDLLLLRLLFTCMLDPGCLDVINFLKKHKYFLQINHIPEVTVYTCNYNTSDYIIQTIESVLSQNYSDFEYIIYDDCSEDSSVNKIIEYCTNLPKAHRDKITLLRGKKNVGLPAACNYVLGMARGRYIMRVDSDDIIHSNFLSRCLEEIKVKNSECIFSGYNEIDSDGETIREVSTNQFHPGCSLISRWCVNDLKFKEDLEYMEGAEFFERFRKLYKYNFIDDILWGYRRREGQKTQSPEHPRNV